MKNFSKMLCLSLFALSLESCLLNINGSYTYNNSEDYSVGNAEIYDTVRNVDIDWISGSVKFEVTDENYLYFIEENSLSYTKSKRVHYFYDEDSRTLKIKFCKSSNQVLFNDLKKNITIYVPQNYNSLVLKANTVSADIISFVPCISNAEIDTVSGNAKVKGAEEIQDLEFNSVSGDLSCTADTIISLNSDTTSGDVSVTIKNSNKMTFDSVSGDVYVACPKKLGFVVDFDSVSDNFKTNVYVSTKDSKYYYGNKGLKIEMSSVSGDLEVYVE